MAVAAPILDRLPRIRDLCRTRGIRRLSVFGSAVRDDFRPESDVDLLVEFLPDRVPGLDFFAIEEDFSRLLGRRVDLQTLGFLGPALRPVVLSEAVDLHVEA